MAETYSAETNGQLDTSGRSAIDPHVYGANLERMRATIPYDGQANGDTVVLGELPPGAVFAFGIINASATAGAAATIAIGVAGTPAKFRTAAVFTTADTPTLFGNAAPVAADPVNTKQRVIATIGAAALPNTADYLVVDLYYTSMAS